MAESTSKLRAQVAALTNVDGKGGFDIMQDEDTFKSIYDIMLGISKVWDEMTDVKQSALLELLAGKVRSNQVAALLNNMSRAEEILQTSENSAGTMEEVHARWLDSIAAKQAQLAASWENLSQTMMSSDVIKFFYDSGSNILNTIDRLIQGVGSLTPALTAVGTGVFGMIGKGNALTGVKSFGQMLGFGGSKDAVRGDFINAYNSVYNDTLDKQQALGAAVQAVGGHMNDAERFAVQYSKAQIGVGNGATIASMKLTSLKEVLKGIGTNLAVGAAMAGVSYLISLAVNAWNDYANAEERAVQAADDANAEYKDAQAQVQSLEKELENTQKQYDELAAKGPLNFADEQTKADLKEQTDELRLQLQIAKEIEAERGKAAYESDKAAWEKQYSNNTSAPAVLAGKGVSRTGTEYIEFAKQRVDNYIKAWTLPRDFENDFLRSATMASIEDPHNIHSPLPTTDVASQANKYVKNGLVGNDITGAIAIFKYLKEAEDNAIAELARWENISSETAIEGSKYTAGEVKDIYIGVQKTAHSSMVSLKAAMIKEYADLGDHLDEMALHGETNTQQYEYMYSLWDQLGQATVPIQHQEKVLSNLIKASQRGDKRFAKTYNELTKLAKTTEITADTLNDQKYDDFREELERNGIEITNLIALLNQMREASGQAIDLSTTTASGIKDRVTNLLGYRDTAATIHKNTGYGSRGISEDDYQSLVDMNDTDYLKAVESSHGTIWFNQAKFNEILTKKISDQYTEMYTSMARAQSDYVKETKKLNDMLLDLSKEHTAEERANIKNRINDQVKNLDTIRQEIALYNRLAAQIKASSTAYGRWQLAKGGPQEGDDYDEALEAYKVLQEGFKSGRVGTADYKAAQEYLLGPDANYYGSKEQRKKLERYLTKTKGKVDGWGARNFYSDLQELNVLDANGRLTKEWSPEEIGKMVGIGPELVTQIFGEMNEFIADESKKYQLKSPTLEEQSQANDYDLYLKAKQAYDNALNEYDKSGDEGALLKARLEFLKAAGEISPEAYDNAMATLDQSTEQLSSSLDATTAAINGLIAALTQMNLAGEYNVGYDNLKGEYYVNDKDGKTLVKGTYDSVLKFISGLDNFAQNLANEIDALNTAAKSTGNKMRYDEKEQKFIVTDMYGKETKYDTKVEATAALFDKSARDASEIVKQLNLFAASQGIDKQVTHGDDGMWHVGDTAYADLTAAISAMFSDYTAQQTGLITQLTGAVVALTGDNNQNKGLGEKLNDSMKESGATFGEAALQGWATQLKTSGNKMFRLNENGKFELAGVEYDNLADVLAKAYQDSFKESPYEGLAAIQQTLAATPNSKYRRADYDKEKGEYVLTDAEGNEHRFSEATSAMADIAEENVNALRETYAQLNKSLEEGGSTLRATIEEGQSTLVNTATGEKTKLEGLASGIEATVSTAKSNLEKVVSQINTINANYGAAAIKVALVNAAIGGLNEAIDKGGKDVSASLKALNDALSLEGIDDKVGLTADGKYSFAGKIFDSVDTLMSGIAESLQSTPETAERMVNNVLKNLGRTEDKFTYDKDKGVYRLTGPNVNEEYKSMQEALSDITGGGLSNLSDVVVALNNAYKAAGESIQLSIENGQSVLKTIDGKVIEAKSNIDQHISEQSTKVASALDAVLAGIQDITLKVEADGKFTLVGADGKPIMGADGKPQTFSDLSVALQQYLPNSLSGLESAITGLNGILDGFKIDENGVIGDGTLMSALASSIQDVSAATVAKILGDTGITTDGKFTKDGKIFDTYQKLIQEQFKSSGLVGAIADDSGAFKQNKGAVDEATGALNSFSAALAASSITKMLEQTGKGGYVTAGKNGTLNYYDKAGGLAGVWANPEEAYRHLFPEFGDWQFARDENGDWTATKENTNLKDGEKIVDGLDRYTEKIGNLTKITLDVSGAGRINDNYGFTGGQVRVENGQMILDANGSELALGDVKSFTTDGNNTTFTLSNGTVVTEAGVYAIDKNGSKIARPDDTVIKRLTNDAANDRVPDDKSEVYRTLVDYVNAAGEGADADAKAAVDAINNAKVRIQQRQEAEAKAEAERKAAEEAAARAAEREKKYNATELSKIRGASDELSDNEIDDIIGRMYDVAALSKKFGKSEHLIPQWLVYEASEEDVIAAEKHRREGSSGFDITRSAIQQEQAVADEAARKELEARRKKTEETFNGFIKTVADGVVKSVGITADTKTQEVDNTRDSTHKAIDDIGEGIKTVLETDPELQAQAAADTLKPMADAATNGVKAAADFTGQFVSGVVNGAENAGKAVIDFITKDAEQKYDPLVEAKNNGLGALLNYYNKHNGEGFQDTYNQLDKLFFMGKLGPSEEQLPAIRNDEDSKIMRMMYSLARFAEMTEAERAQMMRPQIAPPEQKPGLYQLPTNQEPQRHFGNGEIKAASPTQVEEEAERAVDEVLLSHAKQLVRDAEVGALNGNVDIMSRPVVAGSKLTEAGWGEDTGDIATVYTSSYDADGKILHVTPILPNGDVLSPDALRDYIDKITSSDISPQEADNPANGGLGLLVWEQDVQDNFEKAIRLANEFDNQLHLQQQELYAGATPQVGGEVINELSETPVEVDVEADTSAAKSKMDTDLGSKKYTATVNVQYNDPGFTPRSGTESVQAAASGTSNADAGTSLVDEQGAELIEHVSRGTYELGTDNGPRFTQLDKGDIVHTAEETKKIKKRGLFSRIRDAFRKGGVKGGGAFAKGIDPDAMEWYKPTSVTKKSSSPVSPDYSHTVYFGPKTGDYLVEGSGGPLMKSGSGGGSGSKKKSAGAKIKDALKWAEKFVDWIPTALDILKKKTTDYIKAAEKSVGYLAKNTELTSAIANVRSEIDLNTQAVERYKKQANDFAKRAGLSSNIVKLIQEGAIDIKQYDENTRKAIQTYQTWWDKAKGCLDTIESLNDQMYDLAKQKLDNIVTHFGNIDDQLNEQIKTFNSLIEVKEAYGQEMTRDDYLDAIRLTGDVISNLEAEQAALTDEFERQVNSGVIKVGSDDWYNYAKQIEELNSALSEAKVDLSNLNDEVKNISLNNLKTSIYYLDNLQTKIEGLQKLREAQGGSAEINSYRELISTGMEQIKNLEEQNSELRKQMEGLDVLSEKYQEINKQLQDNDDQIMDIKANQEQWNDAILDMKIEVLQKQNEKYQQQISLMKALNDLEDARQRRVLLYDNEAGFHYVMDEKALEDAQDTVNDQVYDLVISGLEAQKENNNIYDNMGNQLIPVTDMLSGIDFSQYYDSINRGSENSSLLTNALKSIDMAKLLEGTVGGDVKIDIGDIVLNGVNDAKELGDAIIAQLPGYLVQALYAKGS